MSAALPLAILGTGLVTPVGLDAPSSCAAFRAKISNPSETCFIGSDGQPIMAHQVELERPWRGLAKLTRMAAMAIEEALQDMPRKQWHQLPLVLCVAEQERPGRLDGLDDRLMKMIEAELGIAFAEHSAIVPQGRVGAAVALHGARRLIAERKAPCVLIAATDSLLNWQTLSHYDGEGRLLAQRNSNGFIPGEGAGAVLVSAATSGSDALTCTGVGFGREAAHINTDEPLRGDGLADSMKAALAEAGLALHDIDYRITDISGEHYYFKEAALAVQRTLRKRKPDFDIWHPAECTGEQGAASGASIIALGRTAAAKGFSMGPRLLAHWANDAGQRAAATFEHRSAW